MVIRFNIEGGEKLGYMQPIGEDGSHDFADIIPLLARDAHSHGNRLRMIDLTEEGCEGLNTLYGKCFALHSDPAFEDYIYLRESLSTLSGKRLQPKRNHINKFRALYPTYEYHPLTPSHFEACEELDCKWRAAHGDECDDLTPERCAMLHAFENFKELGLHGGVLYIDGELAAFTYGSAINSDTFCIHIEKGLTQYAGCYTMINQLFASSLPSNYKYINREEDLGIEGLRRAKLSYYPDHKQTKYTAIYLHHDEMECKRLWQTVFGDEDRFIDEFLINHYSESGMLRMVDSQNRYQSMLHIIPFNCEIGRVAYIYAVATHPEARDMGHATRLMRAAMERIHKDGYNAAILIPSEEWLIEYYKRFGFEERKIPTIFRTYNNFDFGSGDTARDLAMIYPISPSNEIPDSLTLFSHK